MIENENEAEGEPDKIHILGSDTPTHATKIASFVSIPGVDIEIVSERSNFVNYTKLPDSVPEGNVLISIEVPTDKTIELMKQMSDALNITR